MPLKPISLIALCCLVASCQTPVAYRFQVATAADEPDVKTELAFDPTGRRGISVRLTNQTDQVIQVNWRQVTLVDQRGTVTTPRPTVDLGWVKPGETQVAELSPFSLPEGGPEAHQYEGRHFTLRLPMVIRNEPRSLTFVMTTQVSSAAELEMK